MMRNHPLIVAAIIARINRGQTIYSSKARVTEPYLVQVEDFFSLPGVQISNPLIMIQSQGST